MKKLLKRGIIDPTDITFNGEEIKTLAEAVFENIFQHPALNAIHSIVTGIKAKKQIVILGALDLLGKKQDGCAPENNPSQIGMSQKFWDPEYIEDRFSQCWKDLQESFFIYSLKNGVEKPDLTGTDFADFVETRITQALLETVWRLVWFSDKDAALVSASPAGTITAGTDVDYFNPIDGFWKQIYSIVAADSTKKVAISKNSGANYAAQKFDPTDISNKVAESIFDGLVYGADFRFRGDSGQMIVCTQSLADQYARELRSRNVDSSFQRIEGGYNALYFEGVPVVPISFWDRYIAKYFNNGTKLHLPHRAVLMTKDNFQIGTEEESNFTELKPWYNEDKKTYNVDMAFNIDAKIIEDYKLMAAF
jgi:hypothetical protein